MKKLRKYLVVPYREKGLFLEALLLHLWVGLLIRVIPFRRIPRFFSGRQSPAGSQQSEITAQKESQSPREVSGRPPVDIECIRLAVQRAGRVSPWQNKCFISSLAGRVMLNRRDIASQLSLGVAKEADGRVRSHAWLVADDYEIVEKGGDFTQMYLF